MNTSASTYRTALLRAILFCADTLMILLVLATFILAFSLGTDIRLPPLMWLMLENFESYMYAVAPLGAAWFYNRIRSRKFDPAQLVTLRSDFMDSWALSRIPFALAVLGTLAIGFTGPVLAALGFFGGVMVASGAGAALKARMIGVVHEKSQLPIALVSALAILLASWLASWAHLSVAGFVIHGGYWAPVLGILAGVFLSTGDENKDQAAASAA